MRSVKTWLRSVMSNNSLNYQMFANVHKNLLYNINLRAIADDFVNSREIGRKNFGLHCS